MKATGIVRRIDDLGRVVIPKEIRRTMRIREGDPLEIYTDKDGEVILKKYSPIGEISSFAKDYTESLFRALGHIACICDRDMVVSASGVPRWYMALGLLAGALAWRQAVSGAGHLPDHRRRRVHRRGAPALARAERQDGRHGAQGRRNHRVHRRQADGAVNRRCRRSSCGALLCGRAPCTEPVKKLYCRPSILLEFHGASCYH